MSVESSGRAVGEITATDADPGTPRSSWRVLLTGAIWLGACVGLAIGLKRLAERDGGRWLGLLREKQSLGWLPYFLASAGLALGLVYLLALWIRGIGLIWPVLQFKVKSPAGQRGGAGRWAWRSLGALLWLWRRVAIQLLAVASAALPIWLMAWLGRLAFVSLKSLGGAKW